VKEPPEIYSWCPAYRPGIMRFVMMEELEQCLVCDYCQPFSLCPDFQSTKKFTQLMDLKPKESK
jgi:hypothetical protein